MEARFDASMATGLSPPEPESRTNVHHFSYSVHETAHNLKYLIPIPRIRLPTSDTTETEKKRRVNSPYLTSTSLSNVLPRLDQAHSTKKITFPA